MTLGGNICVRNGISLDYTWREAIESLLPVCESVTVCDGQSTDGTQDEIRAWSQKDPRVRLCIYPWPNPKGNITFWVDWLNFAREHIKEDFQIQLDADEVLSEVSYPEILEFKKRPGTDRVALWCHRYNFWRDAKSLIPPPECCSHHVVRVAPTSMWLPSDGCHEKGNDVVALAVESGIELFHYGFIRERGAWFRKAKALQEFFFDSYDKRLIDVESKAGNWMTEIENVEWINRLVPFAGQHPVIARQWLAERGWATV